MTDVERMAFIETWTKPTRPPLVPEVTLRLSEQSIPIWQAIEKATGKGYTPPPYWAFCWPGGQALTRWVLDRPELVRGKRVLDFAAGCAVFAIGAARVGASEVLATEIDPLAIAAAQLNARENGVTIDARDLDVVDQDLGWDVVCAGDVCYERPMAERVFRWLRVLAKRGALVLMGDPGRNYLPTDGLEKLGTYVVPTSRELEDRDTRETGVWRVLG